MDYLAGLNERQKEAVLHTQGPVSVLAGAGSGKTRVLTSRIYHLIREGVAPNKILAVTFTNKAAREMRERLHKMLGEDVSRNPRDLPFIATFHGLGREILETHGRLIGVPRYFSIFDRDDSERAIKQALKELDVDPKEVPPRAILSRISKAKGQGMKSDEFHARNARDSFRMRIAAEAWLKYEGTLKKEKALDFDDLIMLPVRLLQEYPEAKEAMQKRFEYVHIDEFQDTNELQGRLSSLITEKHRNIFVVGDIDQCLVKGTKVRMADGSEKAIEKIKAGDSVLSAYGSGVFKAARVTRSRVRKATALVEIRTAGGSILTSTPEHVHFAGYRLGLAPQVYVTYLMHKRGKGWRLGVSSTYTRGQRKPMLGFKQRCNHEHADAVWVVGVHENPQAARVDEYRLSLTYGIPTLPFVARKGSTGGYVHDQKTLDAIFASLKSEQGAVALLVDKHLSLDYPHHRAQATRSDRRNVVVTLCGDSRRVSSLHRISIVGSDVAGKDALAAAGFSVRSAKRDSASWRFETAYADFTSVNACIKKLRHIFPSAHIVHSARFGINKTGIRETNSLPFLPAASVLPGMSMFKKDGSYDLVTSVKRLSTDPKTLYDVDIERTHNFIANDIVTHNCIYTWRGATIDNLLAFDTKYKDARTIVLEENYRSTNTIVAAGNQIIEKNKNRKEKRSTTNKADGEQIRVNIAQSADGEARWIAGEAKRLIREGLGAQNIAVLFRTNFQSRALEEAFLKEGVPYRMLGVRFFERKEVKDVVSWIRVALDPTREAERMRAMTAPARGIGKTTIGKLLAGKSAELRPAERSKVGAFDAVIAQLHEAAAISVPSAFVRLVIEKSGMAAALRKGAEDDQERLLNAQELATFASRFDSTSGIEGISAFLADASLSGDQDELDRPQDGGEETGVTLMTVHAAKGLEFDAVFVSGLEQGLFPHEGMNDEDRDEEEERRLFYVAVTRAKEKLYLTLARVRRIYGVDYMAEPSQFINDIDAGLVHIEESQWDTLPSIM